MTVCLQYVAVTHKNSQQYIVHKCHFLIVPFYVQPYAEEIWGAWRVGIKVIPLFG